MVCAGNQKAGPSAHRYYFAPRQYIHPDPDQARSITVREAARLQSFPDDFEFLGSMGDQYKMVGNAVPPVLAKIVAESVASFFDENLVKQNDPETSWNLILKK